MGRPRDTNKILRICPCCGEEKTEKELYLSHDNIYQAWNNRVPICKSCLSVIYNAYVEKYKIDAKNSGVSYKDSYYQKKAIRRVCMMINMYYDDAIYDSLTNDDEKTMFSSYMQKTGIVPYRHYSYDDTLKKEENKKEDPKENIVDFDNVEEVNKVTKKTLKFFGSGFSEEDYLFLQSQYDDWTTRHECKTKAQEEMFKQICFTQLELLKATRADKDTKDLNATLLKQLEAAKLQPKQNHSDAMSDAQTFGTLIDKWENTRPLPEIDEDLKDVDKIGLYMDVFFRGHLAKMMGMKNGLSRLYDKYMKKYTVTKPDYKIDEDNEALFDSIFGDPANLEKE